MPGLGRTSAGFCASAGLRSILPNTVGILSAMAGARHRVPYSVIILSVNMEPSGSLCRDLGSRFNGICTVNSYIGANEVIGTARTTCHLTASLG